MKPPETTRTHPKPAESSQKRPETHPYRNMLLSKKITRNYPGNNKRPKRK